MRIFRFPEHPEHVSEDTLFLLLNIFSWIVTCVLFWVCTLQSRCQISTTKNGQHIPFSGFVKNPTCLHTFIEIYVGSYASVDIFRMVGRFLRKPASFKLYGIIHLAHKILWQFHEIKFLYTSSFSFLPCINPVSMTSQNPKCLISRHLKNTILARSFLYLFRKTCVNRAYSAIN